MSVAQDPQPAPTPVDQATHSAFEQLAALYARAERSAYALLLLMVVTVVLLWGRVDPGLLLAWALVVAAMEGIRVALARRFARERASPRLERRWFRNALLPAAGSGLAWGLVGVYLIATGHGAAMLAAFVLTVMVMALAALGYSPHRMVHGLHVSLLAAPPAVALLTGASETGSLLGLALMGLACVFLISGSLTAQQVKDNARLRREREALETTVGSLHQRIESAQGLNRLISFQSSHDSLTGLVNRREFEARLQRAVITANNEERQHVLCYLDLDHLDMVNDTCGHPAGDALLRQVAAELQTIVRGTDTLARLGGDQFAALLSNCRVEDAMERAESLRDAIRRMRFPWEDHVFEVSASIGVAGIGPSTAHYSDALSAAHAACLVARQEGGSRVRRYQAADRQLVHHRHLARWMQKVRDAVQNSRFQLLVQEIVPIDPARGLGRQGELLVRMLDEHGRLVAPHTFLSAAERYNLMPAVDRWVIDNALGALERNAQSLSALSSCAVNLSGQSLSDPDFLDYVVGLLGAREIPPERLCFEITETAAIENLDTAREFIAELKGRGCRFALDDFGSGMSSYGYLKQLPVDYLKIDGSFVRGMLDNPTDRAVVESINQIGHGLDMRTVAEFVENDEILAVLAEIGVDYAQGSAVGEPKPVE